MNSRKRMFAALAIAYVVSLTAHADECVLPPAPSKIPDGQTASEREMLTAMGTMKQYTADVDTYLRCLEFERKQNHLSEKDETRQHNDAIDIAKRVANKFNEQVRTYKSKSG
jgi:hypothetical protein